MTDSNVQQLNEIVKIQRRREEDIRKAFAEYQKLPRHEIKLPDSVRTYYMGDKFNGD